MNKVNGFQQIIKFFNSKTSNKVFTRNEYFMAMENLRMKDSYKDSIRCYLVNAGYLLDFEPGVYRKLKKIPDNITIRQLLTEAYPDSVERRRKARNLKFTQLPLGVKPKTRRISGVSIIRG